MRGDWISVMLLPWLNDEPVVKRRVCRCSTVRWLGTLNRSVSDRTSGTIAEVRRRVRIRLGAALLGVIVPARICAEHPLVRHPLGGGELNALVLLRVAGQVRDYAKLRRGHAGSDDVYR